MSEPHSRAGETGEAIMAEAERQTSKCGRDTYCIYPTNLRVAELQAQMKQYQEEIAALQRSKMASFAAHTAAVL